MIKRAVITVGGWATRFLPASKAVPKALFPILDKPIIHWVVEEAVAAGIEDVIFSIGRNNQSIIDYFTPSPELEALLERKQSPLLMDVRRLSTLARFTFTLQQPRDGLSGLGAVIWSARHLVGDEPFVVILPNDLIDAPVPCLSTIIRTSESLHASVLTLTRVPVQEIGTYGNVSSEPFDVPDESQASGIPPRLHKITRLVQRPDPGKQLSDLAIIGRYVLTPEIFPVLERIPAGFDGELQLTDALEALCRSGRRILGYELEGRYLDTRTESGYLRAAVAFARKYRGWTE